MIHSAIEPRPSPLWRALRRSAAESGIVLAALAEDERPWATATFTGALQRIELAADAAAPLAAWLTTLPEAELAMPGHVVVDLTIEAPATVVALVMRIDAPAGT